MTRQLPWQPGALARHRGRLLALALVALTVLPTAATARASPARTALVTPAELARPSASVTRSFEDLGSPRQSLRLEGVVSAYSFSIPVSARERVLGGTVHLDTVNSTALIERRSEVRVSLNNRILAQYQLDPLRTHGVQDIALPAAMLTPGYAEVRVEVVQHYTDKCENPLSPELWTQIDGKRSSVTLNLAGRVALAAPRLSQLSTLFDRRRWGPQRLVVVPGSDAGGAAQMSAAAMAVQGLGLRQGQRALEIAVQSAAAADSARGTGDFPGLAPEVYQGQDVLLVGKRAELSRYLSPELARLVRGPFVGVFPVKGGNSVVLVVSGDTDAELLQAARAVADPNYPFADSPTAQVPSVAVPLAKDIVVPGMQTPFTALGFQTQTLRAGVSANAVVDFRVPGQFMTRKNDVALLDLHLSYGSGLRSGSALDVYVNDTFIQAIALSEGQGVEIASAVVKVPAQALKPGLNSMSFKSSLLASSEQCAADPIGRGVLTLFEDSALNVPVPTLGAKAPDLARFSQSLWPYAGTVKLMLTSREPLTASAGLELMVLMAQKNRAAFETTVHYELPASGHTVLVGPFGELPPSLQQNWVSFARSTGAQMYALQAVQEQRVLTAFTALNAGALRDGIGLLHTKGLWRGLAGSAAVVDGHDQSLRLESPNEPREVVSDGSPVRQDWRLTLAGIVTVVGGGSLATAFMVRRRIRARANAVVP